MKFGAVILCGGKSRRMGTDKARLTIDGVPFLERIAFELREFEELLISVDSFENHPRTAYPSVADIYPNCGPMGGIHAALRTSESDALLVLSCDLPLYSHELGEYLCRQLSPDADTVVPTTSDGRLHPLCAVYRKTALPVFEQQLKTGNFRMRDALARLHAVYVPIDRTPCSEKWLENVNTQNEYRTLREDKSN